MKDIDTWTWRVNKDENTISNDDYRIVVKMQKEDGGLKGKLLDMPIELFSEISKLKNGEKIIEKIVASAERKFFTGLAASA